MEASHYLHFIIVGDFVKMRHYFYWEQ